MSDMPERMWAWAWEVDRHRGQWTERQEIIGEGTEYVRADAIPAAQVTVKPLVWFEVEKYRYGGKYTSEGYTIRYIEGFFILDFAGNGKTVWRFPTLEAAKAAAQADYEARIRSALTVTPHDPANVQALVDAGERMTGPLWRLILADEHCLKSPCDMPTCECRQKFDRIAGPWTAALAAMNEV